MLLCICSSFKRVVSRARVVRAALAVAAGVVDALMTLLTRAVASVAR